MKNLRLWVHYGGILGIWLGGIEAFAAAPQENALAQTLQVQGLRADTARWLESPPAGEPRHRVELFRAFGKTPVLLISYPWKEYARPSIEVRFLSQNTVDNARIQPLFFRSRYMKAKMVEEVYECLIQAAEVPVHKTLTEEGLDWHLLADRTILGRVGMCVVQEIPGDTQLRTEAEVAVAYPLLEGWAQDAQHVCLELPASYYPQPGQIRVWFLRENRVLWTEKLTWPGVKGASSPAPSAQPSPGPAGLAKPKQKAPSQKAPVGEPASG